jgi:hypothetical protein
MWEHLQDNSNVVVAIIAVVGVLITAWITLKNNNKNVLIKTVTEERAKWRNDLRDLVASFIKEALVQMKNDIISIENIYEIKAKIVFRLNPDKNHHLDQDILTKLKRIVDNIENPTMSKSLINDLARLEEFVQTLVKQEWEKSKKEAKTGKLGK